MEEDNPLFGRVEDIYIVNTNDVHFKVELLSTVEFNYHHHCFVVEYTHSQKIVYISSLYSVFPLYLRNSSISGHARLCVIPKHHYT